MLAIWMYFWDEAGWVPDTTSVSAVEVVAIDLGSGGGHRHDQAPPDYWDVRERYLRYLNPEPKEEEEQTAEPVEVVSLSAPPPIQILPRLIAERPVVLQKIEDSIDLKVLEANFRRLQELDRRINLLQKQKEQLLELERLNEQRLRNERRQARLKRQKAIADNLKQVAKAYLAYILYRSMT